MAWPKSNSRYMSNLAIGIISCLIATSMLNQVNLLVTEKSSSNRISDSCHWRELELCYVGAGAFLQSPKGLPNTKAELDRLCELFDESATCFTNYGEHCLTSDQTRFIGMLSGSVFELERDFCHGDSQLRRNYMEHSNCLRQFQKQHQAECFTQLQVAFEPIHKTKHTLRLPLTCCNIKRFKDCLLPNVAKECGDEAFALVSSVLKRAIGERLWLVCKQYEPNSDQCQSLLPPITAKPYNGRNTSAISRLLSSYSQIKLSF